MLSVLGSVLEVDLHLTAHRLAMLFQQIVDTLGGVEQVADRFVVVERINDVSHVLAHIDLNVPLFGKKLGR